MPDLLMPKFGLTMTEGLLTEWHVRPGQAFKAGDALFTVETEKVANEVEAEADGVLADVLVGAGETVPVGTPIARLVDDGAAPRPVVDAMPKAAAEPPAPVRAARPAPVSSGGGRRLATPLARRIARDNGVDLASVVGSGPRGRIKADDVRQAAERTAAPARPGAKEIVPDAARLATARMVSASKRDTPHFYVTNEAETSALMALRRDLNLEPGRARVSVTHMLIRALGLALTEMPGMNRIWAGDRILEFPTADIGMLAETPAGLRIPVVRDAGGQSLDAIAAAATALTARARDGALGPGDVGDGVLSISNVGMIGASSVTPIINPPSSMILGVGAERQVFRPDENRQPALKREITLTLAVDHRVIDGADAARFLGLVVEILETPIRLLRPARGAN